MQSLEYSDFYYRMEAFWDRKKDIVPNNGSMSYWIKIIESFYTSLQIKIELDL